MFYPDKKPHMSPSALDAWMHNRSLFVRSYFEEEKSPETAAMTGGKRIHALVEAGLIEAENVYDVAEQEIRMMLEGGVQFMGIPDSRQSKAEGGEVEFVDYKTGKANSWAAKLPTDVKMRATAWLVWKATGEPGLVRGKIEFMPTTWDPVAKEVVPLEGGDSETIETTYTAAELAEFTKVIMKAIEDVNAFYERWKEKTDAFISGPDVEAYTQLRAQKDQIDVDLEELEERILAQMEFGGLANYKTPLGTLYITETKKYEYPLELAVRVGADEYTLEEAAEVDSAAKAAKKNYEMIAEPKEVTRGLGFRKARK